MSIFSTGAATVVRQRPNLALSIVAGIVVFVVVARRRSAGNTGSCPPHRSLRAPCRPRRRSSSTVRTSRRTERGMRFWPNLGQMSATICALKSEHRGDATVISVSASDLPRESLVPLVNVVASAFVQTCRSQWKVETEQAYSNAQERLREARTGGRGSRFAAGSATAASKRSGRSGASGSRVRTAGRAFGGNGGQSAMD